MSINQVDSELSSMERMFRHNSRINAFLLGVLSANELRLSDESGGQSIFDLMAHLAHTRSWSVKSISPAHAEKVAPAMRRDEDGTIHVLVQSVEEIQNILTIGDEALLDAVKETANADQPRERPYIDPHMILARTFNHDAHHRGQIMTILRQHGVKHPELNRMLFTSWADL